MNNSGSEWFTRVAVQADGKVVVAYCNSGSDEYGQVIRYDADGTNKEVVQLSNHNFVSSGKEHIRGLAIQPDGKIVSGGVQQLTSSNYGFHVKRNTPAGPLDHSFSPGNNLPFPDGSGSAVYAWPTSATSSTYNDLVMSPDGKIFVIRSSTDGLLHVARLNNDGSLDTTFDGDGFVELNLTADGVAIDVRRNSLAARPDGGLAIVG